MPRKKVRFKVPKKKNSTKTAISKCLIKISSELHNLATELNKLQVALSNDCELSSSDDDDYDTCQEEDCEGSLSFICPLPPFFASMRYGTFYMVNFDGLYGLGRQWGTMRDILTHEHKFLCNMSCMSVSSVHEGLFRLFNVNLSGAPHPVLKGTCTNALASMEPIEQGNFYVVCISTMSLLVRLGKHELEYVYSKYKCSNIKIYDPIYLHTAIHVMFGTQEFLKK